VQVVEYIPFNRVDAADLFDEIPGGYVGDGVPW